MTDIPAGAETFSLMGALRMRKEPSRLLPNVMKSAPYIACPRCERERPLPDDRRAVNCAGCGLFMCVTGDLVVWTEKEAVT